MSTGPADDGAVTAAPQPALYLLDYGGGNVRSVINAIKAAGCTSLKLIESVDDFAKVGDWSASVCVWAGKGSVN
jgi:hypothetical protein